MFNQILQWTLLISPWFVFIFLDKQRVRRYLPSGLFSSLLLSIAFQMADKFDWWRVKDNVFFLSNTTPFVYGVFLVGTVVILYFTYQSFWLYIAINLIVDSFQAFGISKWYEHLGIYELVKFNSFGVLLLSLAIALLIFVFQKWMDPIFKTG